MKNDGATYTVMDDERVLARSVPAEDVAEAMRDARDPGDASVIDDRDGTVVIGGTDGTEATLNAVETLLETHEAQHVVAADAQRFVPGGPEVNTREIPAGGFRNNREIAAFLAAHDWNAISDGGDCLVFINPETSDKLIATVALTEGVPVVRAGRGRGGKPHSKAKVIARLLGVSPAAPAAPLVLTIACGSATTIDTIVAAFLGSKWFPIRSRAGAGDAVHATVGDEVHATLRVQPGTILVEQAGTSKGAPARAKAVARFFERIAAGQTVARPYLPDETQG